jgi:hypothetical protein
VSVFVAALLLASTVGCLSEEDRCGKHARLQRIALGVNCLSFAYLDAGAPDAPVAPDAGTGGAPVVADGGPPPDAAPRGTWGDECTRDDQCGAPDPVNGPTDRCAIQENGMPFPTQTHGICTKTGCDPDAQTGCPGPDWICIRPSDFSFAGFPNACWCFTKGGAGNCTP